MPTRAEIYQAIRNADKAGDSAAVRRLGEYLTTMPPDGAPAPAADPAAEKAQRMAALPKSRQNIADDAEALRRESIADRPGKGVAAGMLDMEASLASQTVAQPVAGVASIAQGVRNFFSDDPTNRSAADRVAQVSGKLTWQPRSSVGQQAAANVGKPFQKLSQGADWLGQKAADATGSPLVGAAVNTATQMAPAILLRKPKEASAAPGVNQAATEAAANVAKAKAYVGTAGLDWDSLSASLQAKLTSIARSAGSLEQLDPKALAREARLQSLPVPVPATRGQITRDAAAMRREANVAATDAGLPIKEINDAGNAALLSNLDVLKGKVSGKGQTAAVGTNAEDVGRAVQDSALGAKQTKAKAATNTAYKAARETEPTAAVSAQPLYSMLEGSPEMSRLPWLDGWLRKNKVTTTETAADGTTVQTQRGVTLNELDDLRKKAGEIAKTGGTDAHYAREVLKTIDSSMEEIPGAAKAWQAARAAHRAERAEFGDQGAVGKLVGEKAGTTDRRVALESTAKTIAAGSLEDIRSVKQSLLTGGDTATRTAGRQAWREVRAQLVQQIKDEATKGVAQTTDGTPNLTPGALKRAIDRIGTDRLNEIFGPGTKRQLDSILQAAVDTKTMPALGGPSVGSTTVQNALAILTKGLDVIGKVPLVGETAVGAVKGIQKLRDLGAASRDAKTAATTPLSEALSNAATRASREAAKRQAKAAVPLVPLSALSNPENRVRK